MNTAKKYLKIIKYKTQDPKYKALPKEMQLSNHLADQVFKS